MPIDFGSMPALATSLKTAAEMTKAMVGIRDATMIQGRIIELLEGLIWTLAGTDHHVGRLFTCRLDVRPKSEIMDALLKPKDGPPGVEAIWCEVRKVLPSLQENRNWIAHGIWKAGLDTKAAVLSHRKGKPGERFTGIKVFKLAELDQLVAQIEECHEKLRAARQLLEPPSSPETPQPRSRGHSSRDRAPSRHKFRPRPSQA